MKIIRPATFTEGTTPFSRAGSAYMWDKTGTLVLVGSDVPRWSYDPGDLSKPPALLLEPYTGNNLITYSVNFAGWTSNGAAMIQNYGTSPDGTVSSTLVDGSLGTQYFHLSGLTAGVSYTYSVFVRRTLASRINVYMDGYQLGGSASAVFDFDAENFVSVDSLLVAGFQKCANGWFRVWVTFSAVSDMDNVHLYPNNSTGEFWGANFTVGGISSYIYSSGTTAIRAAETIGDMLITPIVENDYSTWSSTTVYVTGDRVMSTVTHRVYESVVGEVYNVKITSSAASTPYNLLWPAHGLKVGEAVLFTAITPTTANISANTVYYVSAIVDADNFKIQDSSGNVINSTAAWASVAATKASTNIGIDPTGSSSSGIWIDAGPTNRYAVFDKSISTQASSSDFVGVAFKVGGSLAADSVVIQNANATAARVVLFSATDGIVYDQTISLIQPLDIADHWSYCFEPIVRVTDTLFNDMPPYMDATLIISVAATDQTVKAGLFFWGLSKDFGPTQAGMNIGTQDYSVKSADEFGYFTLLERPYSKTMTLTAFVKRAAMSNLINLLTSLRATPAVYIGDENLAASFQYGFPKDWSMGADYPEESTLHIEIESLT